MIAATHRGRGHRSYRIFKANSPFDPDTYLHVVSCSGRTYFSVLWTPILQPHQKHPLAVDIDRTSALKLIAFAEG